jgi:hypothetical protein
MIGLLELYRNDPVELPAYINSMIQWIRDNGPANMGLMDWSDSKLTCGTFAKNVFEAVKLARCKLNPPSTGTLQSRKDSLLGYLEDCLSDEAVMSAEIQVRINLYTTKTDRFCDINGGHYSQFCCGQYQGWLASVQAFEQSRLPYIQDMADLVKCLEMLEMPTCENQIHPPSVDAYIEQVNSEVSTVGQTQLQKKAEWVALKATFTETNPECQSGTDD